MAAFDPAEYRVSARREWRDAAPGWRAWMDVLEADDAGRLISNTLVELSAIGPGDTVLDVGAGYGEPGLTAARSVLPGGTVVCTDMSSAMLAVARERASSQGLDNVEFVEQDAEDLAFPHDSFDAVLSRQGLQFVTDVEAVLVALRSLLRPGGRLAAAVWGPAATVQFAAPAPIIRAELGLPPPPADAPGPFALGDAGRLIELATSAGFDNVRTGTITASYRFASPEQATSWLRDVAPPITAMVEQAPSAVREQVWAKVTQAWAPFTSSSGGVQLDNQAIWVGGTAG